MTKYLQQSGSGIIWDSGTTNKLLSQNGSGIEWEAGARTRKVLTDNLEWDTLSSWPAYTPIASLRSSTTSTTLSPNYGYTIYYDAGAGAVVSSTPVTKTALTPPRTSGSNVNFFTIINAGTTNNTIVTHAIADSNPGRILGLQFTVGYAASLETQFNTNSMTAYHDWTTYYSPQSTPGGTTAQTVLPHNGSTGRTWAFTNNTTASKTVRCIDNGVCTVTSSTFSASTDTAIGPIMNLKPSYTNGTMYTVSYNGLNYIYFPTGHLTSAKDGSTACAEYNPAWTPKYSIANRANNNAGQLPNITYPGNSDFKFRGNANDAATLFIGG